MNDLLPCPFCGGESELNSDNEEGYNYIRCDSCKMEQRVFARKKEAIEAWNTRAERTCTIEHWGGGVFYLFCGDDMHECQGFTKPNYCPVCGAKVVKE